MNPATIAWSGASGQKYLYRIYPFPACLHESPGNYILAKRTRYGFWIPCLVGETNNLKHCLRGLENDRVVRRFGATHVHAHNTPGSEKERQMEAQDLLRMWNPFGNEIIKYAERIDHSLVKRLPLFQ